MDPADNTQTIRQRIIDLLMNGESTLRDLSQALSISEKEVVEHLGHIQQTLRHQGGNLLETPYKCISCGFIFSKRTRFSKPGRCPSCKNSHIQTATFHIKMKSAEQLSMNKSTE